MKISYTPIFRHLPKLCLTIVSLFCLLVFPTEIADGVKKGLLLSSESVIPALFPFMVLSAYISSSPYCKKFADFIDDFSRKFFNISGMGFTAVLLGILGGYPIGAKATEEFYLQQKLSIDDAHRTLNWCVNPSPSFVITAVGSFMLNNTKSGILMYTSLLLSSFTIGFASRFTGNNATQTTLCKETASIDNKDIFVKSVASACKAMLAVCGWVLLFSAICAGLDKLIRNESVSLFVKALSEVTTGCQATIGNGISLALICALLGFGGFAVIFQIAPYLSACKYSLKFFICWRALSGALSAFYCSVLLKIFPDAQAVIQTIPVGNSQITLSHSTIATIILLLTCIVFILEVDNRKKIW